MTVQPAIEGKPVLYQIRTWNDQVREMLAEAHKLGCHLRFTSDQHVKVVNDIGSHTTIAGKNRNMNLRRTKTDLRRVVDEQREHKMLEKTITAESPPVTGVPTPVMEALTTTGVEPDKLTGSVNLPDGVLCNFHKPPIWFETQADLDTHREAQHVQCKRLVPDEATGGMKECGDWLKNPKSMGGHTGVKHSDNQPWTHKRNYKGGTTKTKANGVTTNTEAVNDAPVKPTVQVLDTDRLRESARLAAKATGGVRQPRRTPRPGTVEELLANVRKGKGRPVETVHLPTMSSNGIKPEPVAEAEVDPRDEAVVKLLAVRAALGEDPRLKEVTRERDEWKRRAEDAETKIAMIRAQADQLSAAVAL